MNSNAAKVYGWVITIPDARTSRYAEIDVATTTISEDRAVDLAKQWARCYHTTATIYTEYEDGARFRDGAYDAEGKPR